MITTIDAEIETLAAEKISAANAEKARREAAERIRVEKEKAAQRAAEAVKQAAEAERRREADLRDRLRAAQKTRQAADEKDAQTRNVIASHTGTVAELEGEVKRLAAHKTQIANFIATRFAEAEARGEKADLELSEELKEQKQAARQAQADLAAAREKLADVTLAEGVLNGNAGHAAQAAHAAGLKVQALAGELVSLLAERDAIQIQREAAALSRKLDRIAGFLKAAEAAPASPKPTAKFVEAFKAITDRSAEVSREAAMRQDQRNFMHLAGRPVMFSAPHWSAAFSAEGLKAGAAVWEDLHRRLITDADAQPDFGGAA